MPSEGKLEVEVEVKSTPDKFWGALCESETVFLKAFPNRFKSIEIIEGDGKQVGSVRHIKYADGLPMMTEGKERIDALDEAKKTMSYSVIDGELTEFYKSFKANVGVSGKGEGSLVKWSCEFDKAKEETPDPHLFQDIAISTFKDLDAYLLKA